jgi:hypothetical protein
MLRVYCEFVPMPELADRALFRAFRHRAICPMIAVTPETLDGLAPVLATAAAESVPVGLWPMLASSDGRWLSLRTGAAFRAHLDRVLALLDSGEGRSRSPPVREVHFDLEPPLTDVRRLVRPSASALRTLLRRDGAREAVDPSRPVASCVERVRERGLSASAVVAPVIACDPPPVSQAPPTGIGWQAALGTPVDGLAFDRVDVMIYPSLVEGYVPMATRRDATTALAALARAARQRFGRRAGVCLGLTGGGALGDERAYRDVAELAEDAAISRGAGIDRLSLHGLAGALERGPLEPWLDAMAARAPGPSLPSSRRAAVAVGLLKAAARPLAWLTHASRRAR